MSLQPDCLAELNLHQAPFDSLPNEDFIYTDNLIEETVAAASQAIDMSGAILLLTGEVGSGRSMQLMRLLGSLPENFELIAFRARLNTRFEAVDFTIRSHLQAGGHDDPDRALSDLMSERIRAGYDPVIAVDDAHLLGMDIINILLRMRGEILGVEGRAPRLVLVGDQVLLRRRLQMRPSDENQIARFTLRPFSLEQTAAYLTHRLRAAGMADPGEILTEDAIADLQASGRGLPGPLNEQANAWLERLCRARRGEEEQEPEPEPEPLRDDRMAAFTRGMPPLGVTGDPPDEPPEDLTPVGRRESPQPTGEPEQAPAPDEDWDPYTGRMQKRASESDDDRVPFWSRSWFVPVVAAVVAFLILAPFARHLFDRPEPPPTTTVQLPLPVAPEEEPAPTPEVAWPDEQGVVELPFDDRVPAEMPAREPPAPERPDAPAAPEPAPEPPPDPEPQPAPEPAPPPPEPEPEPPATPAPEPAPPAAEPVDLAADRAWLGRQSRDNFTIQLIAAPDLDGARRFVDQHQLAGIRYVSPPARTGASSWWPWPAASPRAPPPNRPSGTCPPRCAPTSPGSVRWGRSRTSSAERSPDSGRRRRRPPDPPQSVMAGRIPQAFIDDLLERTDLVELVQRHVPLKKSGSEFSACCPFHAEKTPSFYVSPQKQFYHCFGCGAHGTAITFLMEYENLSFPEAIDQLAEWAGLEVPRESAGPETEPLAPLLEALEAASRFYVEQLRQHPAAIDYLKARGIDGKTARDFALGWAPAGTDTLARALGNRFGTETLLAAGLAARRDDGSIRDRFRARIVFPIRDRRGRVTGFGGRLIEAGEPKYLNSPESAVFHKGHTIYGLYEARRAETRLAELVVTEGYMDVVGLAQAGFRRAVACMGTALTRSHLELLFRQVPRLVLCFDGDAAGRRAAWRSLEQALPVIQGMREVRTLFLPEGEDPDSLVRHEGLEGWERRLAGSAVLSETFMRLLGERYPLDTAEGRSQCAHAAVKLIRTVTDPLFRTQLCDLVADRTRTPSAQVFAMLGEPADTPGAGDVSGAPGPARRPALRGRIGRVSARASCGRRCSHA